MFIASASVIFVVMAVLYLSENRLASFVFIGVSAGFAAVNTIALPLRKDIWEYLVAHSYDGIPSYNHIQYYDTAMGIFCGFAAAVAVAVIVAEITESRFLHRTADVIVLLVMVAMGTAYTVLVLTAISKYYDASELYTSPFIKGEMILLLSFTVRKIIRINKAPE